MTHYVYRVFAYDDTLMYVGCTNNVSARMAAHRYRGTFRGRYARHEAVEYPDRPTALAAEAAAIAAERPLLNVHHQKPDPLCASEVRAAIARTRVSKGHLARAVGISPRMLGKKLSARAWFAPAELDAIAAFLGVPRERMGEPDRSRQFGVSA